MVKSILTSAKDITTRDTLFGDLPLAYWAKTDAKAEPWSLFREVKKSIEKGDEDKAIETLKTILTLPGLESRQYLQATHFLTQLGGVPEGPIELLGAVVEVTMEEGVDLLAVYADHSARYYNYSGSSVLWDAQDVHIAGKIDHVLLLGKEILRQIGPWDGERPAVPPQGYARINFLTSHGLHFGEAPQGALFKDPMAGKIMYAMLDMMETLTDKVNPR